MSPIHIIGSQKSNHETCRNSDHATGSSNISELRSCKHRNLDYATCQIMRCVVKLVPMEHLAARASLEIGIENGKMEYFENGV